MADSCYACVEGRLMAVVALYVCATVQGRSGGTWPLCGSVQKCVRAAGGGAPNADAAAASWKEITRSTIYLCPRARLGCLVRPVGRGLAGMSPATPTLGRSKPERTVGHPNFWRKQALIRSPQI